MKNDEIVVLFSGGTDSTLTATLMAEKFRKVHLITYERFGLFSITNSQMNVPKLKNKFGEDKITHRIIKIEKLSKYVFYERYFRNLIKHRFFLLSNCGLCKLAMHVRSVIFCLDNEISNICDGANKGMSIFPFQMKCVIDETAKMYSKFGINYTTPIFDFEGSQNIGFIDRLHLGKILLEEKRENIEEKRKRTTEYELFELGLMPSENVKGTELDRKMQPRCFQFILFNIFVRWYYFYNRTYQEYERDTLTFYKDKINFFTKLIEEYVERRDKSKLFRLIEGG